MKTGVFVASCGIAFSSLYAQTFVSSSAAAQSSQDMLKSGSPGLAADYGKLPLSFVANQGQSDPQVKFLSRGSGYSLFLTDKKAVLALTKPDLSSKQLDSRTRAGKTPLALAKVVKPAKTDVVRMELLGASHGMRVTGAEPLPGTANYFIGNDLAQWHSNVPTYSKVKFTSVYPGVDLIYYGNQRQLEYDFVVAPGANTKQVKLHFAGAEKLKLNPNGDMTVIAKNGEIAFHKPVVYQLRSGQPKDELKAGPQVSESASQREMVNGKFAL